MQALDIPFPALDRNAASTSSIKTAYCVANSELKNEPGSAPEFRIYQNHHYHPSCDVRGLIPLITSLFIMSDLVENAIPNDAMHTGFWVNWSYGQIRGATLTLSHRNGGLLTAFLALFITIVGRSFWRLFCFIVHSRLSKPENPQHTLHHQQQVVLRNAATGMIGLQLFSQLAWKWRHITARHRFRTFLLMSLTAIIMTVFYMASIFSSEVRALTKDGVRAALVPCLQPEIGTTALSKFSGLPLKPSYAITFFDIHKIL